MRGRPAKGRRHKHSLGFGRKLTYVIAETAEATASAGDANGFTRHNGRRVVHLGLALPRWRRTVVRDRELVSSIQDVWSDAEQMVVEFREAAEQLGRPELAARIETDWDKACAIIGTFYQRAEELEAMDEAMLRLLQPPGATGEATS